MASSDAAVVAAEQPALVCRAVSQWKSCRSGRKTWDEFDVAKLAEDMVAHLPEAARRIIDDGSWKGGPIARLDSLLARPSAGDVVLNFHLMKPVLLHSPGRVPSLESIFLRSDWWGRPSSAQGFLMIGQFHPLRSHQGTF